MFSRGTIEEKSGLVEQQDFEFPVIQWNDEVANDYKVPGTPYIYFISEEQKISLAGFRPELDTVAESINTIREEGG